MNLNYEDWLTPNVDQEIYWELKEACKLIAGFTPYCDDNFNLNVELKATNHRMELKKQEIFFDYKNDIHKKIKIINRQDEYKTLSMQKAIQLNYEFVKATDFIKWAISKEFLIPKEITNGLELIHKKIKDENNSDNPIWKQDPRDPEPEQPWYIPARYFARKLIEEDASLKTKRNLLAQKVQKQLTENQVFKRGGKTKLQSSTILKAFIKII